MNFDKYLKMHSEIIMFYQLIENDIKWIYSHMLVGDIRENRALVENMTLGQIVRKLKVLDNSDNYPWICKSDYKFLQEMTSDRNYWVHKNFTDILDEEDYSRFYPNKFHDNFLKLKSDHERINKVKENILNIRKGIL